MQLSIKPSSIALLKTYMVRTSIIEIALGRCCCSRGPPKLNVKAARSAGPTAQLTLWCWHIVRRILRECPCDVESTGHGQTDRGLQAYGIHGEAVGHRQAPHRK